MPVGTQFGRYVILDLQGAGGMGVVYSAYDPKLDRRVALKLLRPTAEDAADAGARLLREAQALAKLKHPNVVGVHDSGILGDVVFVEMELVDGLTLDAWAKDRPWREVLEAYVQAGRALAAVHGVGLIHRDFKPSNAIVDPDGRVRVLDFGVARASSDPYDDAPTNPAAGNSGDDVVLAPRADVPAVPETEWGKATGTPSFMPPEQWRGHAIDARADQYAFASSLFRDFYGVLPFSQPTAAMMVSAWTRGPVLARLPGSRVPAYVYRALVRALAFAPMDRFATMDELLDALQRDPAAALRRRVMAAVAFVAVILGAMGAYRYVHAREAGACGASEKLAGAWDADKIGRVHDALTKSAKPSTGEVWSRTKRLLDEYALAWVKMRTEACQEARHASRQVEDAALGARLVCLDWRLRELRALTDLLSTESNLGHGSIDAATALVPIADCANAAMRDAVRPYEDPAVRARVDAVRTKVAEADARRLAGRAKSARPIAAAAVEEARTTNVTAAVAHALLTRGRVEDADGDYKKASATLEEAVWAAEAARDDPTLVSATTSLAFLTGYRFEDTAGGARWEKHAMAALERLGAPDGPAAEVAAMRASLAGRRLDLTEQLAHAQRALDLSVRAHGPKDRKVAGAENSIAIAFAGLAREDDAMIHYEREREILEQALGPTHPDCATPLINEANVHSRRGDEAAALGLYRRALAIREPAVGSDHPSVALILHNIALAQITLGDLAEGRLTLERSMAIRRKVFGEEHQLIASSLSTLADIDGRLHKYGDARSQYTRSIEMSEKLGGRENPSVCAALLGLADVCLREKKPAEALALGERALAIRVKKLGAEHPDTASSLTMIGRSHIALGNAARATPLLEHASLLSKDRPRALAGAEFALARALRETSGSPTRARALATGAAAGYAKQGAGNKDDLEEVQAWMTANERWLSPPD